MMLSHLGVFFNQWQETALGFQAIHRFFLVGVMAHGT